MIFDVCHEVREGQSYNTKLLFAYSIVFLLACAVEFSRS